MCEKLTITGFSGITFAQERPAEVNENILSNPRIVPDNNMNAGQKVTWDCIWFGSYPQAEIVSSGRKYTALPEELLWTGDLI